MYLQASLLLLSLLLFCFLTTSRAWHNSKKSKFGKITVNRPLTKNVLNVCPHLLPFCGSNRALHLLSVMAVRFILRFRSFRLQPTAQPKHCYVLDPSCSVSDMKETKAGGRPLFYFELEWPSMASSKQEGEEEGEGESGRCVCAVCGFVTSSYLRSTSVRPTTA